MYAEDYLYYIVPSPSTTLNESNKNPNMKCNLSFGHGLIDACFILCYCTVGKQYCKLVPNVIEICWVVGCWSFSKRCVKQKKSIWLFSKKFWNSKKNSFLGNSLRKYGMLLNKECKSLKPYSMEKNHMSFLSFSNLTQCVFYVIKSPSLKLRNYFCSTLYSAKLRKRSKW